MFHRLALSIPFILLTYFTYSQETQSVYFKTGSHKISSYSQKTLEKIFANLDYTQLIEIKFIGYSDSIGNIDSNQKLSEKRAKGVAKSVKQYLSTTISVVTESKGELPRKVDSLSRRVDVIFRYSELSDLDETDTIAIQPDDPRCFFVDENIESYSNVTVKLNKKKKVVYLQVLNEKEFSSRKYYYLKNPSKTNAVAQRVNFKLETTGMLWWREKRLTATIPKDSYEKYGLFYLENPPCDGCKEQLFKKDTNIFTGNAIKDDHFLMSVTQLKTKFFRPNILKIRVPKEYIHENESYYAVKNYGYTEKTESLKWEEKRGKRKENYLFAKINIKKVERVSIARPQRFSFCPGRDTGRLGGNDSGFGCGGGISGSFPIAVYFSPTVSAFYHNDTITAFLSVGLDFELKQHQLSLNVGLNHRLGLYYSAYYRFEIFSFEMMRNRLLDPWQMAKNTRFSTRVGIYAGPEFRSSYNKRYKSFSELNLHAGFSVDWENGLGYYVHGGVARDLSNRINTGFYPYIQAGIRFRFQF